MPTPIPSAPNLPPIHRCLIVVTGLRRSGTSMLMQMLAAGGMGVLSDEFREPDEDNPRGYLEFEPVKNLLADSSWLRGALGKAVKIVVPLLVAIPTELPSRVILVERDFDEVLDSQHRMLLRRNEAPPTAERRRVLTEEYARTLTRAKLMLATRPHTRVLTLQHRDAIAPQLHRNRA